MGNSDSSQRGTQYYERNNAQDGYTEGLLEELDIREEDERQRERGRRDAR